MGLKAYNQKRNFTVTDEPPGRSGRKHGDSFVIQKHAARRLHYDLRLELDGVMKSWAVTRGPSLVPGDKRLAVHTEDHPIEYNKFEGNIPKGEYGGGAVLMWDRGRWRPIGDPHKAYTKGHLEFELEGAKLHGRWHLVRMRKRPQDRQEPWLLIKGDDAAARGPNDPDILEEEPRSVVTGRTIDDVAADRPPRVRKPNIPPKPENRDQPESKANLPRRGSTEAPLVPKKTPAGKRASRSSIESGKAAPAAKRRANAADRDTAERMGRTRRIAATASASAIVRSPARESTRAKKSASRLPDFVAPLLATLRDKPPSGPEWLHEVKYDGYRMQARVADGEVVLNTRKGLDWTAKFRSVARDLATLEADTAVIDGEIVVQDESGVSDFSGLQSELKAGRDDRFIYYVFDLLYLDGRDLTTLPLLERKRLLEDLLRRSQKEGIVRYSDHVEDSGAVVLRHACEMGLEGIVSKRRDAPYRSGRGDSWVKAKCNQGQELVIVGYADSAAAPRAIGALVLGYYEDGKLYYAGRTGTGYTEKTARELWTRLQPLRVDKSPLQPVPTEERRRGANWVRPELVAEIKFRGWTGTNLIRHSVFVALREDKPAREVTREAAMPSRQIAETATPKAMPRRRSKAPSATADARQSSAVQLTNPDRIYWTDVDITKQQLADYYRSVWDIMAPHAANRPLALVRCPEGVGTECFFQKHAAAGLKTKHIRTFRDSKGEELLYFDNFDGLLALVQAGVLEIHIWGSTVQRVELCDRLVFDLDPGDDVPWPVVSAGARELRERLRGLKLESFLKTTGGKGLHVVVPCNGSDWDAAKSFAHRVVLDMEADSPDRYVSKMAKKLRHGRIFVDYLRNGRGATSIAAYSTRARPGAPISVPVTWEELGPRLSPSKYTLLNIGRRLAKQKHDPWAEIGKVRQNLPPLKPPRGR